MADPTPKQIPIAAQSPPWYDLITEHSEPALIDTYNQAMLNWKSYLCDLQAAYAQLVGAKDDIKFHSNTRTAWAEGFELQTTGPLGDQGLDITADLARIIALLHDLIREIPQGALFEDEFYRQWPKACHDCGASGWGPASYNPEYGNDVDYCGSCWQRCPRCARRFTSEQRWEDFRCGSFACPKCGWHAEDRTAVARRQAHPAPTTTEEQPSAAVL